MRLTKQEQEWLDRQPKVVVGDVVAEMNKRYKEYIDRMLPHSKIDAQVRGDFAAFGATDKSIVFTDGAEPPYSRQ
jgi:hypothetical protein